MANELAFAGPIQPLPTCVIERGYVSSTVITAGQWVYLNGSGQWALAQSNSLTTCSGTVGMAANSTAGAGQYLAVALLGTVVTGLATFGSAISISGATWSGGAATFTNTGTNGLVAGQQIAVSGFTVTGYNGTWIVLSGSLTNTTFTVTMADPGSSGGSGTAYRVPNPGDALAISPNTAGSLVIVGNSLVKGFLTNGAGNFMTLVGFWGGVSGVYANSIVLDVAPTGIAV